MANRAFPDRLSDLPLSIIHDILDRVPIRDAIRTCVLSTQWRHTWTTLPNLLFSCANIAEEMTEGFEEKTTNFITNVLLHHRGPIHRFEMAYSSHFSIERVGEWLLHLSRNDIRELIIQINWDRDSDPSLLNYSIYSCTKLTKLKLCNFTLLPPPSTFNGFLFLTTLVLRGTNLSPDGVERLLANSPLLERLTIANSLLDTLTIVNLGSSGRFTISAKNLKYICLLGEYTELCLHAPLLDEIYVKLKAENFTQSSDSNYTNFFRDLTNLVKLTGHQYFTRYLSIGIESCQHTLVLHHLKVLELTRVNFDDMKEMSVLARLISGAPNLHRFQVLPSNEGDGSGSPDIPFRDFGCGPDFTLAKLRVVTMTFIRSCRSGMQLIKFLLASSPVLETMKLRFIGKGHFDVFSAELKGFRPASPNARILVNY